MIETVLGRRCPIAREMKQIKVSRALALDLAMTYLHCDGLIIHHDLFRQATGWHALDWELYRVHINVQICANGGLVLVAEALVHILVHQRCLSDTT